MSIMHLEVVIPAFDSGYSQYREKFLHVIVETCN